MAHSPHPHAEFGELFLSIGAPRRWLPKFLEVSEEKGLHFLFGLNLPQSGVGQLLSGSPSKPGLAPQIQEQIHGVHALQKLPSLMALNVKCLTLGTIISHIYGVGEGGS